MRTDVSTSLTKSQQTGRKARALELHPASGETFETIEDQRAAKPPPRDQVNEDRINQ